MLQGRVSRLNALSHLGLFGLTIVFAAGCEQIPTPRANSVPIHIPQPNPGLPPLSESQAKATAATPVVDAPTAQAAAMVPTNLASAINPPTEASSVGQATPLLDEALAQAEEIKRLDLESVDESEKSLVKHATIVATAEADTHSTTTGASSSPPKPKPSAEPTQEPAKPLTIAMASPSSPPIDPEKPTPPPKTPTDRWREGLEDLRKLAREQERNTDPAAATWTLREHLLDLLDEAEDHTALRRSIFKSFLSLGSEWQPTEDQERANELREAVAAIEEQAPLEVTDIRLCRKVNGFGSFDAIDPSECQPGQPLIVYCEVSGVRYAETGENFKSRLTSHIELLSSKGGEPLLKQTIPVEDFCRRRRRDYFVNYRITLPEGLEAGKYEMRLTQEDELAGRTATSKISLTIHP